MEKFLTLVVPPDTSSILCSNLENMISSFSDIGCSVSHTRWLSDGIACDLLFHDGNPRSIEQQAREFFAGKPVDILSGDASGRRKKLLIADMDSTIVTTETLDDLAAHAGNKDKIAAITAQGLRGDLDFEESVRKRIAMIAGLPLSAIEKTLTEVTLSKGAQTLVHTMRAHGAYTALVSGGFSVFTEPVAGWCDFHENHSNTLGVADGQLTGHVLGDILGREAKLLILDTLAANRGLSRADALSIGDGANDLDMIDAAGLGIAYYGKSLLMNAARASIQHTDLTTALYYQGFAETDFVHS